jgi:hypothetical protein
MVVLIFGRVSLRMRRPSGQRWVQMLVAYGVRGDGSRRLLGYLRSPRKIKRPGRVCCRIFIDADLKARSCC